MTDNVISLVKSGEKRGPSVNDAAEDELKLHIKRQNEELLTDYMKMVEDGQVRSMLAISVNYDGSVNWSVAGQTSSFEIIAALERTKHDFMDTE